MSIQFECLANGTNCDLDGASTHVIALATGTSMDMFGKGSDELDSIVNGDVGEHDIHIMEGFDEVLPMVPIALPFCMRHHHDARINALPFSLEKMHEAILLFRQKPCHEQFCRGKDELKVSKNLLSEMTNVWSVAMLWWKVPMPCWPWCC